MRNLLFSLALAAVGCGTGNGEDTQADSVVPLEGMYTISSVLTDNACGDWGPTFQDSFDGFSVQVGFPDEETARFYWVSEQDCLRDGAQVACPAEEPVVLDDYAPDNDARIMYESSADFVWSSPSEASGQWTVRLSCAGEQCELVAGINGDSYPCDILLDWTLGLAD